MEALKVQPLTWWYRSGVLHFKCITFNEIKTYSIELGNSYLLKYIDEVSAEEAKDVMKTYDASKLYLSEVDNKCIILRNPIITEAITGTTDIKIDPLGTITSFFQILNIKPYQYFIVESNKSNEIINERNIRPYEERGSRNRKKIYKRVYWDIEVVTPRDEFVYAKYIDNHVISISLIYKDDSIEKRYFLYWGSARVNDTSFISELFQSERELLTRFLELIAELQPDRMYTFNGDFFDIPYLAERYLLHGIGDRNLFARKRIKGRFQWETVNVFNIPGIEHLDILRIMLRFYPGLPNYKLETIGTLFLGEGKTGLDIQEMFKSFYIQSEEGMGELAKYSVKDSLLLMKLNDKLDLDTLLENVCNATGTLVNDILNVDNNTLIDRLVYTIDPGFLFVQGNKKERGIDNIKMNTIYSDIYYYDYTKYYSLEMPVEFESLVFDLPSILKAELYNSKYVDKPAYSNIDELLKQPGILEVTNTTIKSNLPLIDLYEGSLTLLKSYKKYLQLGKLSYAALDSQGRIEVNGTKGILRPGFTIAKDYLNDVLKYIFGVVMNKPEYNLRSTSHILEDFLLETKLKNIKEYPVGSEKHILSTQLGENIETWTKVKYYMTTNGPVLQKLYAGQELNADYYEKKLKEISVLLRTLSG